MIGTGGKPGETNINTQSSWGYFDCRTICHDDVFAILRRFQIAGGADYWIIIDPTLFTGKKLIMAPIFWEAFQAGPITIDFHYGINYTPDALKEVTPFNKSIGLGVPSQTKWYQNLIPSNTGTLSPIQDEIYSDGTPAVTILGGKSEVAGSIKVNTNLKYAFKIHNEDVDPVRIKVAMTWAEVHTI